MECHGRKACFPGEEPGNSSLIFGTFLILIYKLLYPELAPSETLAPTDRITRCNIPEDLDYNTAVQT